MDGRVVRDLGTFFRPDLVNWLPVITKFTQGEGNGDVMIGFWLQETLIMNSIANHRASIKMGVGEVL